MSPASAIALGALLFVVFLLLAGAMLWQEVRGRSLSDPTEFIIEDAVQWIWARLRPDERSRLSVPAVRSIIEWQVFGLQQSVKGKAPGSVSVVMGPTDETVDYIQSQIGDYAADDVRAVLAAQSGYLESIGAVGGPAEGSE